MIRNFIYSNFLELLKYNNLIKLDFYQIKIKMEIEF